MSQNLDALRITLALALCVSALFLAWWVSIILMIALAAHSRAWEIILVGFLMDCIWLPAGGLFSPVPVFTLAAIAIAWLFEPIRSRILI